MVQMAVPQKDIAVAMANFSFDGYIGGCIGVTISGTIFSRYMNNALTQGATYKEATCKGVAAVCLWCVPPAVFSAMLAFFVEPVKPKKVLPTDSAPDKEALAATSSTANVSITASNSSLPLVEEVRVARAES